MRAAPAACIRVSCGDTAVRSANLFQFSIRRWFVELRFRFRARQSRAVLTNLSKCSVTIGAGGGNEAQAHTPPPLTAPRAELSVLVKVMHIFLMAKLPPKQKKSVPGALWIPHTRADRSFCVFGQACDDWIVCIMYVRVRAASGRDVWIGSSPRWFVLSCPAVKGQSSSARARGHTPSVAHRARKYFNSKSASSLFSICFGWAVGVSSVPVHSRSSKPQLPSHPFLVLWLRLAPVVVCTRHE